MKANPRQRLYPRLKKQSQKRSNLSTKKTIKGCIELGGKAKKTVIFQTARSQIRETKKTLTKIMDNPIVFNLVIVSINYVFEVIAL